MRKNWKFYISVTLCAVFFSISVEAANATVGGGAVKVYAPESPVDLGRGWNISTGTAAPSSCVTGATPTEAPADITEQIGQFTDQSTISDAFDISAKAQAKFLFASADAETKYELNRKVGTNNSGVAVRASFRQLWALSTNDKIIALSEIAPTAASASVGSSIGLKEPYLTSAKASPKDFKQECGDGYVFAIESGATVAGFFSFKSSTEQANETIQASLKGSYLGQSASGSYSQIIEQLSSQSGSTLTFSQFGGSPTSLPQDANGLIAAIANLPATVKDRATQHQYTLYINLYGPSTVANWPADAPLIGATPESALDQILSRYWMFSGVFDQAQEILGNEQDYILNWGQSTQYVQQTSDLAQDAARLLLNSARACYEGKQCALPTDTSIAMDSYYTLLGRIPLPSGGNSEFSAMVGAWSVASKTVDDYNTRAKELISALNYLNRDPNCYGRDLQFHAYSDPFYAKSMHPVIQNLMSALAAVPDGIKRDVTQRMRNTSRIRCSMGLNNWGCDTEYEINRIAQYIPISTHSVYTNALPDAGNPVYGVCPHVDATIGIK